MKPQTSVETSSVIFPKFPRGANTKIVYPDCVVRGSQMSGGAREFPGGRVH
jgi:hypothetical protein